MLHLVVLLANKSRPVGLLRPHWWDVMESVMAAVIHRLRTPRERIRQDQNEDVDAGAASLPR